MNRIAPLLQGSARYGTQAISIAPMKSAKSSSYPGLAGRITDHPIPLQKLPNLPQLFLQPLKESSSLVSRHVTRDTDLRSDDSSMNFELHHVMHSNKDLFAALAAGTFTSLNPRMKLYFLSLRPDPKEAATATPEKKMAGSFPNRDLLESEIPPLITCDQERVQFSEEKPLSMIEDQSILIIQHFLAELHNHAVQESFEETCATKFLTQLDKHVWENRKDPLLKTLFTTNFFLNLCHLKARYEALENPTFSSPLSVRTIETIMKTALTGATHSQKKILAEILRADEIVQQTNFYCLSKLFFERFSRSIDDTQPITHHYSNLQIIQLIILDCQTKMSIPGNEIMKNILDFAQSELKKVLSDPFYEVDRYSHCNPNLDAIVSIMKDGLEVRHDKKRKGAWASTHLEPSFGQFGLTFSTRELLGKDDTIYVRQCSEDKGAIWMGAQEKLFALQDIVLYTDQVSDLQLCNLKAQLKKAEIDNYALIPMELYEMFQKFSRKYGWAVPVPPLLSRKILELKSRGAEPIENLI